MANYLIPEGYHSITPYLLSPDVNKLLDFLKAAFDAEEKVRKMRPDGTVMHAEVKIGNSMLMMGEPTEAYGAMPTSIYLYVRDCDAMYEKAIAAGGVSVMELTTMSFSGQRYGGVKDPSGNIWWVASQIENLSLEEQERRAKEFFEGKE